MPTISTQTVAADGFSAASAPETISDIITEIQKKAPNAFAPQYLRETALRLQKSVRFYGSEEEVDRSVFTLFRQWIYLELYKLYRLEFLLLNFAKTVALHENIYSDSKKLIALFQQHFPDSFFQNYPDLKQKKQELLNKLEQQFQNPAETLTVKERILGSLEASYLSLQMLQQKERFLQQRYDASDDRYKNEMAKLEELRQSAYHSSAILKTEIFQKEVEPYFSEETLQTSQLTELSVNNFQKSFESYIQNNQNISSVIDYLTGDAMKDFGASLVKALQIPTQNKFRKRIADAFPKALEELLQNQLDTLKEFDTFIMQRDLPADLINSNTQSKLDRSDFHRWLIFVFKEQSIHWLITEDYPFLQSAADDLSNFVNEEKDAQTIKELKIYAMAMGVLAILPLGQNGNRFSSWLGKNIFNTLRIGIVAAEIFVIAKMANVTRLRYLEYKNTKRLARINLEGASLNSLIQEDIAYWELVKQASITGVTFLWSSVYNLRAWPNRAINDKSGKYNLGEVAEMAWNGEALALKDISVNLKTQLKALGSSLRQMKVGTSMTHFQGASFEIASILTQAITMVPAVLPNSVRSLLNSIPKQIYNGVTLGTVMGVMSVTVQTYITSGAIKGFVYAFDKLGFTPPAYWQQSTLNYAYRVKRDAFIKIENELITAKREIVELVGFISTWKQLLKQKDLSVEDANNLKTAIQGAEESIDGILKLQLIRWFFQFEYRVFYNSVMKEMGYGLFVAPNMENPTRMTIILKVAQKTYSYQVTAQELEYLRDRDETPDLNLSPEQFESMINTLLPQKDN